MSAYALSQCRYDASQKRKTLPNVTTKALRIDQRALSSPGPATYRRRGCPDYETAPRACCSHADAGDRSALHQRLR